MFMKELAAKRINRTINLVLTAIVFLIPITFFPPIGADFLKGNLLIISAFLLLFLFTLRSWLTSPVRISFSTFYLPLLVFLIVLAASWVFSVDKRLSLNYLLEAVSLAIIFIIGLSSIKAINELTRVILAFIFSGSILSLLTILKALSLFKWDFTSSVNNLAFIASVVLLLSIGTAMYLKNKALQVVVTLLIILNLICLALSAGIVQLITLCLVFGVFLIYKSKFEDARSINLLSIITVIVLLLIIGLRYLNASPIKPFAESRLPLTYSIDVAFKSLTKNPLLGSGGGTFPLDYSQLRPLSITKTPLWKVNFTSPNSTFLSNLITTGALGTLAFLSLFIFSLLLLTNYLKEVKKHSYNYLTVSLLASLTLGLISYFTIDFSILALFALFVLFLSIIGYLKASGVNHVKEIVFNTKYVELGLFGAGTALMIVVTYFSFKTIAAEYFFQQSLADSQKTPLEVYDLQLSSIRYSPQNDEYHRQFALTNLALAIATLGDKTLPDSTKLDQGQKLINQAINEAKGAVTLSPKNALNQESLGSLYLSLSTALRGASEAATNSFKQALDLDPNSAQLHLSLSRSLEISGKLEESLTELKIASNLVPADSEEFKTIRAEIDKLNSQLPH